MIDELRRGFTGAWTIDAVPLTQPDAGRALAMLAVSGDGLEL
jgi:hypothetical protein